MTYLFTFGYDHRHPGTGESLIRSFIEIPGDIEQSRRIMNALFGNRWASQYPDRVAAKTEKYRLTPISGMRVENPVTTETCDCLSVTVYREWRGEDEIMVVRDMKCSPDSIEGTIV